MHEWLYGTGVALITPFDDQLQVDYEALQRIINHVSEGGVDYLVVLGTTGESVTLSIKEKHEVLSFITQHNTKGLPVVFGLGGYNTQELLEFMPELAGYPLHAILSVTPYYNRPSQEGLVRHYSELADKSKFPVILYNVPTRTGCNIKADTTLRLAKHENIIGIKEASGDLLQCIEIACRRPEDFYLISGDDALTLPIISVGGQGVISVTANAYPAEFSSMVKSALAGKLTDAQKELYKLSEAMKCTVAEGNPTGIKALMHNLGICRNRVRLPLVEASKELQERVANICL